MERIAFSHTHIPTLSPTGTYATSDHPPSLAEQGYWIQIAQNLKHDLRTTRLECLEQVSALVHDAIDANKSAPPHLLEEARQMAPTLRTADSDSHAGMSALEKTLIDSCRRIMTHLGSQGALARYGGTLGNAIFQAVSTKVIIPLLTLHIAEFAGRMTTLSYDGAIAATQVFVNAFLTLAIDEREKVAKMTASAELHTFGKIPEEDLLCDLIYSAPRWSPWSDLIVSGILDVLTPAWKEFLASHSDPDPRDFLPQLAHVKKLNAARAQRHWLKGSTCVYLSDNLYEGRCGVYSKTVAAEPGQKVFFRFNWSIEEDSEKAATAPIVISELVCEHIPAQEYAMETSIAPLFLEVLRLADDPLRLKDSIASIFYDLVRSSWCRRGLASISEWTIRSIAAFHGYTLEFSPLWQAPSCPSPDQQALAELDRDDFIKAAQVHIILTPMILV